MKTYMYQNSDALGTHYNDLFNIMVYHLNNVYVMQMFQ